MRLARSRVCSAVARGWHRLTITLRSSASSCSSTVTDTNGDVLPRPFGLDGSAVAQNAPLLHLHADSALQIGIHVMHPVDVLRSRVANSALANKQTERAARQLDAAVAIVPAYGRMLLDHGADPRLVTNMNESVFRLAYKDARALRLYLSGTADVAEAVLDDPRLPAAHRETRLPQLVRQLAAERGRLANSGLSQAPGPQSPRRNDDRSYHRGNQEPDSGLDL